MATSSLSRRYLPRPMGQRARTAHSAHELVDETIDGGDLAGHLNVLAGEDAWHTCATEAEAFGHLGLDGTEHTHGHEKVTDGGEVPGLATLLDVIHELVH